MARESEEEMTEQELRRTCGNCRYFCKGWCSEPIHMGKDGFSGELKPNDGCSLHEYCKVKEERDEKK